MLLFVSVLSVFLPFSVLLVFTEHHREGRQLIGAGVAFRLLRQSSIIGQGNIQKEIIKLGLTGEIYLIN